MSTDEGLRLLLAFLIGCFVGWVVRARRGPTVV